MKEHREPSRFQHCLVQGTGLPAPDQEEPGQKKISIEEIVDKTVQKMLSRTLKAYDAGQGAYLDRAAATVDKTY